VEWLVNNHTSESMYNFLCDVNNSGFLIHWAYGMRPLHYIYVKVLQLNVVGVIRREWGVVQVAYVH